jgi:hypothetical protein
MYTAPTSPGPATPEGTYAPPKEPAKTVSPAFVRDVGARLASAGGGGGEAAVEIAVAVTGAAGSGWTLGAGVGWLAAAR